jgi:hypothetical protein
VELQAFLATAATVKDIAPTSRMLPVSEPEAAVEKVEDTDLTDLMDS